VQVAGACSDGGFFALDSAEVQISAELWECVVALDDDYTGNDSGDDDPG